MHEVSHSFIALAKTLELRWQSYRSSGDFDQFVEFTLSLNGLTERLNQQNLPGLASACQELENRALGLFTDHTLRPVSDEQAAAISQQLGAILQLLQRHETPAVITKRLTDHADDERDPWIRQRNVLIVSRPGHPWSAALVEQLSFYGFRPHILGWDDEAALDEAPLAIVLVPDHEASTYPPQALDALQRLKARYVASYVYCLSVPASLEAIVGLQRAGANVCIPAEIKLSDILSRILDLVESREQETHRVLIVEDSKTAVAHIQRALDLHGIDSRAINTPLALLQVCAEFRPHAILMDMYMPFCTGVEVTRALRQIPEYQSLPVGQLAVAMIDIDRFKSINDNYGHPVGDQVIRSLAWLLRGRLRNTDLIGRYGGEEFIVTLGGVDANQAANLLNRIREDFSQLPHAHSRGALRASFSCGIAAVPQHLTGSALIEAADEALLQAKRDGRNRIVTAGRKLHLA